MSVIRHVTGCSKLSFWFRNWKFNITRTRSMKNYHQCTKWVYIRSIVFHVLTYTVQDYTVHDTVYCTVFSWVSTSKAIRWYVYWNRIRAHRFSSGKGLAELATARCSSDQADLTMTKNKILQALARCSKNWTISDWNCALCTGGGGGLREVPRLQCNWILADHLPDSVEDVCTVTTVYTFCTQTETTTNIRYEHNHITGVLFY